MKLRTSPYKTPSKAARLALALAAASAIVILQELKREQPLVLIKLPRLDEIAKGLLRAWQGFEIFHQGAAIFIKTNGCSRLSSCKITMAGPRRGRRQGLERATQL